MELTIDQALQKSIEAHQAGQAQEADRLYTAILKAQPKHPDANHNMGVLAVGVGKVQEALPFFKTALEVNPNIAQYWLSYVDALIRLGHLEDARTVLEQARDSDADREAFDQLTERLQQAALAENEEPPQEQVQELINLYNEGQLEAALNQAEKLIKQYPKAFLVWNILGAANKGLGQLAHASKAFRKVTELNPNYADGFSNMGVALKDKGDVDAAIDNYKQAIKVKPDYAEAHYNMGVALKDKGEKDAAIDNYKQALKIKPEFATVKHLLASLIGETTKAAPREYVEDLFDQYAPKFEHLLVEKLEYRIPKIITDMIIKTHPSKALGSVLDLGCGTGLAGLELTQFCKNLDGVDLSKSMLEQARAKGVYDKLIHGDIIEHLTEADLDFDYFISTDVFVYLGELSDVFKLIKYKNKRRGKLVFSTEHNEKQGFHLETSGRYSHSKSYIEGLCDKYGYHLSHFERTKLRKEKSEFLTGGLYLLDFDPAE